MSSRSEYQPHATAHCGGLRSAGQGVVVQERAWPRLGAQARQLFESHGCKMRSRIREVPQPTSIRVIRGQSGQARSDACLAIFLWPCPKRWMNCFRFATCRRRRARTRVSRLGLGMFKSRTFLCCCCAIACNEASQKHIQKRIARKACHLGLLICPLLGSDSKECLVITTIVP